MGDLADLHHRRHQVLDVSQVLFAGEELVAARLPLLLGERAALGVEVVGAVEADAAVKAAVRQA